MRPRPRRLERRRVDVVDGRFEVRMQICLAFWRGSGGIAGRERRGAGKKAAAKASQTTARGKSHVAELEEQIHGLERELSHVRSIVRRYDKRLAKAQENFHLLASNAARLVQEGDERGARLVLQQKFAVAKGWSRLRNTQELYLQMEDKLKQSILLKRSRLVRLRQHGRPSGRRVLGSIQEREDPPYAHLSDRELADLFADL